MPPKFIANVTRALKRPGSKEDAGRAGSSHLQHRASAGGLPAVGTIIGESYRLDAEIGRGGMGIVYRAHDLKHDRDVALKVVNTASAGARGVDQFLNEARMMGRLSHPHIAAVYEIGLVEGSGGSPFPFIAMELINGGSLDELRGLTFARILDLGRQICDALEYAHSQGLVHRDLKPQNVLIEKQGYRYVAKLADFGLARPVEAMPPEDSGVAGSVYYLAPEVIAGQPAGVAADLYALGVLLYQMTTGRVPFSAFDEQTILAQHLNEPVIPPSDSRPDVPPELESIILRLLAKDPHDRFSSAREVCQALEQVEHARGVERPARGNLPLEIDSPPGREEEIAHLRQTIMSSRLVVLVGMEGAERTRWALAAATGLTGQFSDGIWRVDLGSCLDAFAVPQAVAAVLGVDTQPGRPPVVSLVQYLQEKNLLLILDGCEAHTAACVQLSQTILPACPEVSILVTSLRPFDIPEETVYRLFRSG